MRKRLVTVAHALQPLAPPPRCPHFSSSTVGQYRGAASLADVVLGMLFCLGVSVTVTDAIKLMVGRPRPNYSALRALVEFGGKGMSSFKVRGLPYARVWSELECVSCFLFWSFARCSRIGRSDDLTFLVVSCFL